MSIYSHIRVILCLFLTPCYLVNTVLVGQPPMEMDHLEWVNPVQHPLRLSGTFGELRSNHFHMGIDIKSSSGTSGDPVYSVEDGFISQLIVKAAGYGRIIFINHPHRGVTTTYAHLERFTPKLDSLILQKQYTDKQFEVSLNFTMPGLSVRKGELIGYMGNTGNSSGPHLHFEVRNDTTGIALNPLLYQKAASDGSAPVLRSVRMYYLDDHYRPYKWTDLNGNDQKLNSSDTLILPARRIGLGVETFDPHNGGSNRNGIYQIILKEDGKEILGFKMDTLWFAESNYLNAHIDYRESQSSGRQFHKTFTQPGNSLSIYHPLIGSGVVTLHRDLPKKVELSITDFHGNVQNRTFWVKRAEEVTPPPDLLFHYHLAWNKRNLIKNDAVTVDFPMGTLYEDLYMIFRKNPPLQGKSLSPVYSIHDTGVPIHKPFQISISSPLVFQQESRTMVIGRFLKENVVQVYKTTVEDSTCSANVSRLGDYAIVIDSVGPGITTLSENVYRNGFHFQYRVRDNFNRADGPPFHYQAFLDGYWTLTEFDAKSGQLTIKGSNLISGEHLFELIVSDMVGNKTFRKKKFRIP